MFRIAARSSFVDRIPLEMIQESYVMALCSNHKFNISVRQTNLTRVFECFRG